MASPTGEIIELPIRSNFREGLDVLEFFISTHGARKGLADTALRTAESGYLTRRLVDVSQDQIIRETDCGTQTGFVVEAIMNGNDEIESLQERIKGRYAFEDVYDPATGEVLVGKNEMITVKIADNIVDAGIKKVSIRTVFNCQSSIGVCQKCYGMDLTTLKTVTSVKRSERLLHNPSGNRARSLQLRTFHTGGVAGADDITQGLPRVEELFEARRPKGVATVTEIAGHVTLGEGKKGRVVEIITNSGDAEEI